MTISFPRASKTCINNKIFHKTVTNVSKFSRLNSLIKIFAWHGLQQQITDNSSPCSMNHSYELYFFPLCLQVCKTQLPFSYVLATEMKKNVCPTFFIAQNVILTSFRESRGGEVLLSWVWLKQFVYGQCM